jgi:hypothetical protein
MALDYQIDRKIRFVEETEYKSLYGWSLQEFDGVGKKLGSSQIPWNWSLHFRATEVILHETFKLDHDAPIPKKLEPIKEDIEQWKIKTELDSHIRATLRPGKHAKDDDDVVYSFFGTSRAINEFWLSIYPLEKEEEEEHARAWGSVQYEYEGAKLLTELSEDTIQFYLHVKPSRFAQYVEMIRRHPPNVLSLRLSSVHGMYSEWSPATSTKRVKVLGNSKDQGLEIADGVEIKPPELGWIGTFEIMFSTVRETLKPPQRTLAEEKDELEALAAGESATDDVTMTQRTLLQLAVQQRHRSKQLNIAAWMIVGLLIFLLLK